MSIPPSPGNSRSSRAVWMTPASVDGISFAASHTCAKRNQSRGSAASSARLESDRPKCSMSTRMPALLAIDRAHDTSRLGEIAGLRPVREFEAHENPARLREIAQARETIDLSLALGVRKLGDDVPRAELGRRVELGKKSLGLERRIHPEELDVVNRDAGIGKPRLGRLHQRLVAGEIVEHLVGRDARHPQTDVPIAGARRDVDELRRRQRQRGQVRERVVVLHGPGPRVLAMGEESCPREVLSRRWRRDEPSCRANRCP